jgi:muramoyltetrapeptide carboxypeptidase
MGDRRAFLTSFSIGLAGTLAMPGLCFGEPSSDALILAKALRAGDTVGLITPATYVPDPDRIALADRTIKYFGLRMKLARNAGKRMGDYRISVDERLDDLHTMFRDSNVNAVFAIRGGYGTNLVFSSGGFVDRVFFFSGPLVEALLCAGSESKESD